MERMWLDIAVIVKINIILYYLLPKYSTVPQSGKNLVI